MSNDVTQIMDHLKAQANEILSEVLGTRALQSYNSGCPAGNIPYYWQDPRTLSFNSKTYDWIKSNLKSRTVPIELDQSFPNLFINAFSKVGYSLSNADKAILNAARDAATDQQTALLTVWKEAFGSFPAGKGQPIDNIVTEIKTNWTAKSGITLAMLQKAKKLSDLLDNVPASGQPVLPIFANWLNAIGQSISLQDAVSSNNGYLSAALAAAQSPTADNDGLTLNDGTMHPGYNVATPLNDIINGLKNQSSKITCSMTVTKANKDEFQLSIRGGATFHMPALNFLSLNIGGSASCFQDKLVTSESQTTVDMTFTGLTLVTFGPHGFDMATETGWYWMDPIRDAIANGSKDVSGFKFSSAPQIDFTQAGPFGYVCGLAICNHPSIVITTKTANYSQIQTELGQSAQAGVSFLGISLGGSQSSYSNSVQVDAASNTVTITLNPPQELVGGASTDSRGWVLGVLPCYPAVG